MSETMDPSEQITLHSAKGPEEDTPYSQMRSHRSYSSNLSDMSMQTSESDGAICTTPGAEGEVAAGPDCGILSSVHCHLLWHSAFLAQLVPGRVK